MPPVVLANDRPDGLAWDALAAQLATLRSDPRVASSAAEVLLRVLSRLPDHGTATAAVQAFLASTWGSRRKPLDQLSTFIDGFVERRRGAGSAPELRSSLHREYRRQVETECAERWLIFAAQLHGPVLLKDGVEVSPEALKARLRRAQQRYANGSRTGAGADGVLSAPEANVARL